MKRENMKRIVLTVLMAWAGSARQSAASGSPSPDTLRIGIHQAMDSARVAAFQARLAQSHSREAAEHVGETRGALLPHIGASASDVLRSFDLPAMGFSLPGYPSLIDPFNAQDARINGHVSLLNLGDWKRFAAAQRDEESARWDERALGDESALEAARAYLALLGARALVLARETELATARQLDALSQAQKKAGTATQLEVLRAQGQVSSAQGALAAAEGGEEQARYALLRTLGDNLDAYPVLTDSLGLRDDAMSARPESLLTEALASRPEIIAADKRTESARAELGALRSERLPTVELYGDYGLSGRRLNANAEWTETVALQLNWNLWDGGQRHARVTQKSERVRQAELLQRNVRVEVEQEIRSASALMRSSRAQSQYAFDRLRLAEQESRLAEERFRTGVAGNLEVITAQQSLTLAQEAYIQALYTFNKTRLDFLHAANRLSDF